MLGSLCRLYSEWVLERCSSGGLLPVGDILLGVDECISMM